MYWLIVVAGLAVAGMAQSQSIATDPFQALEPDYRKGYERPHPNGTDRQPTQVPSWTPSGIWQPEQLDDYGDTPEPAYRFRGDPPSRGDRPVEGELRFRPLSPRERERMGPSPSMRWRPLDPERRQPDEAPRPQSLFDTLAPDRSAPPAGDWPR